MAYELREGQGSLFKNDKGDNPRRPDYRGSIMLDGIEYTLSAWLKEGRNGGKFLSLQRGDQKVADHQQERVPAARTMEKRHDMDDDAIPV
jgi:uncharacterized protein (DUF736 family)